MQKHPTIGLWMDVQFKQKMMTRLQNRQGSILGERTRRRLRRRIRLYSIRRNRQQDNTIKGVYQINRMTDVLMLSFAYSYVTYIQYAP